ncbi:MAG TPA: polysaccharide deacetylase [Paracoccaceae bacterium]|nr:polysaccharide deacetylase [Paracoccaceae bacterium]
MPTPETDDLPWTWPEDRVTAAVNRIRAGRSLKPAVWPEGARCAVALSFDSDHETLTLRTGRTSPGPLSQGEYGARAAVPRILELLGRHRVPATFFVPAVTAMLHPEEQRRVIDEGHEIGVHSWIHEFNSTLPPEDERDLQMRAADKLEEIAGVRPVGIRTPSWDFSAQTLAITREMGLLYDSSLMADDDPYELLEDGEPTGVVEIPVEWIRDDAPYWMMERERAIRVTAPPAAPLEIWKAEFDAAWEDGGLFQLTLHPHVTGHRARLRAIEALIAHIRGRPGVWFATHADVARHCKAAAGL